jgi:hypothetical protein
MTRAKAPFDELRVVSTVEPQRAPSVEVVLLNISSVRIKTSTRRISFQKRRLNNSEIYP